MTRRIKRDASFDLTLELKDSAFLNTPRESQKNWMLNRLMKEAADELYYLHNIAETLIPGSNDKITFDREQGVLAENEIMEDWQIPVMEKMATLVASARGDILEVGMGRGIASDFIQSFQPKSHTLVECNDEIVAGFDHWRSKYPEQDTSMLHGKWQDQTHQFMQYDGILFHTYPLDEQDFVEQVVQGVTFAEHFFDTAEKHLRPGGVFTYLTNEVDSLGRGHQRALLERFSECRLTLMRNLPIPDETRDSLWLRQLVLVEVRK